PYRSCHQKIKHSPVLLYQCYRNGTTLESGGTVIIATEWNGTGSEEGCAKGTLWQTKDETDKDITKSQYDTCYSEDIMKGIIYYGGKIVEKVSVTINETFEVPQEPYKEKAYLFRFGEYRILICPPAYKIYDIDANCTSAKELLDKDCPDGCGMTPTNI
ncbi:unnamed protein product, partial [Ixodes hexagonus]